MTPVVSVLMSVYNDALYVEEAIVSILQQNFTDFEFVIIDDGSTDGSSKILEDYAQNDLRIKLYKQENSGLISALNFGLSVCSGELIARMDSDDVALPNRLLKQCTFMQSNPSLGVLGSDIDLIDGSGMLLRRFCYPKGEKAVNKFIKHGSPVAHPAVMMRKSAVQKVGGYRKAFLHAEDYDLWFRILEHGYKVDNLDEVLLRYRQTSSGVCFKHGKQQQLATTIIQIAHRMRVAGEKEPFDPAAQVSMQTLTDLPVKFCHGEDYAMTELAYVECLQRPHLTHEDLIDNFTNSQRQLSSGAKAIFYVHEARRQIKKNALGFGMKMLFNAFISSPKLMLGYCYRNCYRAFS